MSGRSDIEYRVLRETIASRGTWRPAVALAGITAWAATLIAVMVLLPYPLVSVVPLLVLATSFEVIRTLHFGAERLGRYLQAFYEEAGEPGKPLADLPAWERVAMALGPSVPGAAGHPLFVPIYLGATAANFLAVALPGPTAVESAALAAVHLGYGVWLVVTDRAMRTQRATELERFRQLRGAADR